MSLSIVPNPRQITITTIVDSQTISPDDTDLGIYRAAAEGTVTLVAPTGTSNIIRIKNLSSTSDLLHVDAGPGITVDDGASFLMAWNASVEFVWDPVINGYTFISRGG